jgi:hypothetical protein
MKLTLLVSMPSAIQPTVTPAPVMPSERAVEAFLFRDWVCVTCSASGSSWTLPCGRQAPGSALTTFLAGLPAPAGLTGSAGPWMIASGMTRCTKGLAFSRASSLRDTVAATALTSR